MKLDKEQKDCHKPQSIEKEACIFAEGKLDQILVELILRNICSVEIKKNIQIFKLRSKDDLKNVKNIPGFNNLKAVLVILDKDEDYMATSQKIDSFFEKLPECCQYKLKFIFPPKESSGKELEDYIIETIATYSENFKLIHEIKKCVYSLIENNLTSDKKLGKKILFTFLLLKDTCSYDGLSLNAGQFKSCIETSLDDFRELKGILEEFISFVKEKILKEGNPEDE